ncbi:MAG TPA: PH domain-containing protein [Candidatus Acidoferrales bacterium]|nr:PH domain-containing protein [Candidatus Acidoferrales bacterium]
MGYVESNLAPGETLVYKTGCHWIVMFWPLLGGLVLGFFGFALFAGGWMATRKSASYQGAIVGGAIAVVAAAALIGGGIIRRAATEVAVSNKRVLIKRGLLSRRSIEVLLPKVESIGVEESLLGRMLGYGTVIVRGTGGTLETFDKIAHPNELRRQIQQQTGSAASA